MALPVIDIREVTHEYAGRTAVDRLSLEVRAGEIFGFLGPNGSGKTTTFRIVSTLVAPTRGEVVYGVAGQAVRLGLSTLMEIRRHLGVVFQSPSLDKELTARENLWHHGHLYGLSGRMLGERIDRLLERVQLGDRARDRVKTFSGGMRRRVEIAKALLSEPPLLLMDEPSTGLDPGARIELWNHLREVQAAGVTVLVTTHLMEEAELCSRLAIMDQGKLVACDAPDALRSQIGADVITLRTKFPVEAQGRLKERFGVESNRFDSVVRFEYEQGAEFIPKVVAAMPGWIDSVSVGKPTLQDVFLRATGRRFANDELDHSIAG